MKTTTQTTLDYKTLKAEFNAKKKKLDSQLYKNKGK